jgi:hypothetical protein
MAGRQRIDLRKEETQLREMLNKAIAEIRRGRYLQGINDKNFAYRTFTAAETCLNDSTGKAGFNAHIYQSEGPRQLMQELHTNSRYGNDRMGRQRTSGRRLDEHTACASEHDGRHWPSASPWRWTKAQLLRID